MRTAPLGRADAPPGTKPIGGTSRFRRDLITLFTLLQERRIKPLIARRFPLAEARRAHELLGTGGVTGKIVLVRDGQSLESRAA